VTEFKRKGKDYLDMDRFLTRAEVLQRLFELWPCAPSVKTIPLAEANGRICASAVFSPHTLPLARVAGPDGIAVRYADFLFGTPDTSAWKEGRDYAAADCGDDFDDTFDTVIAIERVRFGPDGILSLHLDGPLKKGQMTRPRGSAFEEGEELIRAGTKIRPYHMGMLAGGGIEKISVLARPRVAFIPTGDELVPRGTIPVRGQAVESNSLMGAAFLDERQADVRTCPIAEDRKTALEESLDAALRDSDIVIINGGSSMGSEDFVSGLLAGRASFCRHGIRCIPGMPMALGIVDGKPVVNMPGPPFAAFCAFDWCINPLIARWYGQPAPARKRVKVLLDKEITKPAGMEFYARLHLFTDNEGRMRADPIRMDDRYAEGVRRFNALHIMPVGQATYEAGREIEAELLYSDS
jgi:molybdopterin molybdotransferase/putative molybdopterin biosynthesis protein